jgi:hypothetical protein
LDIGVENAGAGPRSVKSSQGSAGPGLAEAYVVWALLGAWALIDVVTYSRIDPGDLYHVSEGGLAGGLGRALVFLNFPAALAAIAIVLLLADRVGWRWPAVLAIALCAIVAWPGVVDQADLDPRWINVAPAAGVALALLLTLRAGRDGWGDPRGDPIRIAVALVLGLVALPWMFALAGFYFPGSDVIYQGHARVHLGEHHGLEGYLLVVTALLLSRQLTRMRRPTLLAVYLSLMIAYGVGNMANDAWYEQVVKRGWVSSRIPDVLQPRPSWMWGLVIVAGALIFFTSLRPRVDETAAHRTSSTS